MQLRGWHRIVSIVVVAVTLYLGLTGTLIELIDWRTIVTAPPPTDANLRAMREDFTGPGNYLVEQAEDYTAAKLPADTQLERLLATVVSGARHTLGPASFRYVELRVVDGRPVGQVKTQDGELRFDATTGASLGQVPMSPIDERKGPPDSQRNTVKHLHRMTTFGDWALWINVFVGTGLMILLVTGLVVYIKAYAARLKLGRVNPFWTGGDWWRSLHRIVSVVCCLFLLVIAASGTWLAVESLVFGYYLKTNLVTLPNGRHVPAAFAVDPSSPMDDAALAPMLKSSLTHYRAAHPTAGIRVVRLRYYGGRPQGVIVTGDDPARQLVYDTNTGQSLGLTEPWYPQTGFPFGWEAHQIAKSIHRGDYFGLTGRATSTLAGLAMIYLSMSGIIMYFQMWRKRRKAGKTSFFWR